MQHNNKVSTPLPKGVPVNPPGGVAPFDKDLPLSAGRALADELTSHAEMMRIWKTGHEAR